MSELELSEIDAMLPNCTQSEGGARLCMLLTMASKADAAVTVSWLGTNPTSARMSTAYELLAAGAPFPKGELPCDVHEYIAIWRVFRREVADYKHVRLAMEPEQSREDLFALLSKGAALRRTLNKTRG